VKSSESVQPRTGQMAAHLPTASHPRVQVPVVSPIHQPGRLLSLARSWWLSHPQSLVAEAIRIWERGGSREEPCLLKDSTWMFSVPWEECSCMATLEGGPAKWPHSALSRKDLLHEQEGVGNMGSDPRSPSEPSLCQGWLFPHQVPTIWLRDLRMRNRKCDCHR
jgi:hypothetical protein